ncbi:alpha/beta hydrolase [Bacteroidota bacterium]
MNKSTYFFMLFSFSLCINAQNIIELPYEKSSSMIWIGNEKEYYTDSWQTQVVTNVSVPTMQVFKPSGETNNGAAVIIAPGGGLFALCIENEGNEAAKWLSKKGFTAFVLKYRIVPTGEDGVAEYSELSKKNPLKVREEVGKVLPLAIADGLSAVSYIRRNAEEYGIEPDKIGFMGFSAGGAVTIGVAFYYSEENRPDFLVPVYPGTSAMAIQKPKKDAPPMLIVCASDDPFDLAPGSIQLYNAWQDQGLRVGLHMYSRGGHGFGMKTQGLPSDDWIQRFFEWSVGEGFTVPVK